FEKYFRKYEKNILKDIEKYTGFKWKSNIIYVWFIDGYYPSISFPLFLNIYKGDKEFTLFSLIHELIHNILLFRIDIAKENSNDFNIKELEAIVQLVTKYVSKRIFKENKLNYLCKKAEFGGRYRFVWKREKELERTWDLEKHPLIKWISKDKKYKVIKNELS
ncbi:MAG: hypothetical protein ACTSVV_06865, partial [Promethearchaeota archaeon]